MLRYLSLLQLNQPHSSFYHLLLQSTRVSPSSTCDLVLIPTMGRTREDFPCMTGSNFAVWNARVRTALDGQCLLGFIDQEDYDGDSDSTAVSSDEDGPDAHETKSSLPPSPSSSDALLSDTGTVILGGREAPPVSKSFTETKRERERRRAMLRAQAKNARAKARAGKKRTTRKPSAHKRRRMERKTRSFLISTIDDAHVLLVEGCTSAYMIYQKLRGRYEASTAHGDPYYINHYLMTIKYEEETDLMEFFLTFERALKAAAEATGIVMTDEQKSLYLYHAMTSSWKPDLAIWKGSKRFIPYTDLKTNIERKVLDDYAKHKYVIEKEALNLSPPLAKPRFR
ncbi:hypothetical protein PHMEG_0002419 [Phytophthora megakarya]|uniref:Retrotransposon Copia-like N-terminal domain-containing protein n=1 Tax=Phytophthora megakarya TaxID=4795 RepID=A0A225WYT5_9STRA|nr:hypothetical protein PHMEG_0002419 [Phytophthora megakarya]